MRRFQQSSSLMIDRLTQMVCLFCLACRTCPLPGCQVIRNSTGYPRIAVVLATGSCLKHASGLPPRVGSSAGTPIPIPPSALELFLRALVGTFTAPFHFCLGLTQSASDWGSVGFETPTPPTEHGTARRVADRKWSLEAGGVGHRHANAMAPTHNTEHLPGSAVL